MPHTPPTLLGTVLGSPEHDAKVRIAKQIRSQLGTYVGRSLKGKIVLDVGFGLGFNTVTMMNEMKPKELYACEPRRAQFNWAVQHGYVRGDIAFPGRLQDWPVSGPAALPRGAVDVATVWLWDIPQIEHDGVLTALARVIKVDGVVIIGLHNHGVSGSWRCEANTVSDRPLHVAEPPAVWKYFGNVMLTHEEDQTLTNKHTLVCR